MASLMRCPDTNRFRYCELIPKKTGCGFNRTLISRSLFYGRGTVSPESKFVHCAVGEPAMFTVPVILESESQKRSMAFPLIVEGGVLLVDRSTLELLIATRPA